MKAAAIAVIAGGVSAATSLGLIAEKAQDWQAFWGIVVGVSTVAIFAWATYRNQKRQDKKFKETKRHNAAMEGKPLKKDLY